MSKRFRVIKNEMNKEKVYNYTSISRLEHEIDSKEKMKENSNGVKYALDNTDSAKYFIEHAIMLNLNISNEDIFHMNKDLTEITYLNNDMILTVNEKGDVSKRYIDKLEYNLNIYNYSYENENEKVVKASHSSIELLINSTEKYVLEYSNTFRGMKFEDIVRSIIRKY